MCVFFKKMRKLTNSSILPTNTILDEEGQTLKRPEEKLARWQRHFEKVLNFYEALMSIHVAKKESSSKTFRPRGSSSVTKQFCN